MGKQLLGIRAMGQRHILLASALVAASLLFAGYAAQASLASGRVARLAAALTPVRFAYPQSAAAVPLLIGLQRGYFKAEGIKLEPQAVASQALEPAIASGQADMTIDNTQSVLATVSNGGAVSIVAQVSTDAPGPAGGTGRELIVPKDSPIHKITDLAGKTVAVQRLGGSLDTGLALILKKARLAPAKILALPGTAMQSALQSGNVAAAAINDPNGPAILATGQFRALSGDPATIAFGPNSPNAVLPVKTSWGKAHKKLLQKFAIALQKSVVYTEGHPNAVRQVMVNDFGTPGSLAANTHWPAYSVVINMKAAQAELSALRLTGYVTHPLTLSKIFLPEATFATTPKKKKK